MAHLREQLEEYQVAQPALAGGGGGGGGSDDGGALALLERPAAGDRWAGGGSRARELHSHPILCAAALRARSLAASMGLAGQEQWP